MLFGLPHQLLKAFSWFRHTWRSRLSGLRTRLPFIPCARTDGRAEKRRCMNYYKFARAKERHTLWMRPNETELSHRWRRRPWQTSKTVS